MTAQLDLPRAAGAPARIGQGTTVEQSRAIAEVQAQVIVAQQFPRSVPGAIAAMEEACAQPELASRAFFRYPRGGETVSGASVHLARELARCWGNVQYGLVELLRDDAHGQSEVMAWAWDVQTNTRDSTTFIVPHKMDTKKGVRELTDMRDIYENNANNGARRMREMIFSVLPVWYRAKAESLCMQTIENGGGKPLAVRIADAVRAFERYRVTPGRIAAKYGYDSVDKLTAHDVAQLGVVYESLRQGTVTVDDEFPPEPSAGTDLLEPAGAPQPKRGARRGKAAQDDAPPPADPPAGDEEVPPEERVSHEHPALDSPEYQSALKIAQAQARRLFGDSGNARQKRLDAASRVLRREPGEPVTSFGHLTINELQLLGDAFAKCAVLDDLDALLRDGEATGVE